MRMVAGSGVGDKRLVDGGARARGSVVFGVFATLMFLALAGRLAQLQVMEREDFTRKAARQIYGTVHDRDRRGVITDSRGVTLASSVPVRSCALDPKALFETEGADPEKVVERLAEMLSLSPAETRRIRAGLEKRRERTLADGTSTEEPYRFLWVKRVVADEEWRRLSAEMEAAEREAGEAWRYRRRWLKKAGERKISLQPEAEKAALDAADGWKRTAQAKEGMFAGVFFPPQYKRVYPHGTLASHILGFCKLDGKVDGIGLEGVERVCDGILRGIAVNRVVARDARSRALSTLVRDDRRTEGMTVRLTIDSVVQSIVEEELKRAVDGYKKEFPEITAHSVMLDPNNGEILAIANYPDYDPNRPGEFPVRNLRNNAVAAVQEPGSTFKPLLIAASLEEGLANFDEEVECSTFRMENGRVIKDIHPYGKMSLLMALVKSSNPAMVRTGLRLGPKKMREYVLRYGFGSATGSGFSDEVKGKVTQAGNWSSYTMGSVPMGYEINVTSLQMAAAYSAIANGGMLPKPHIVRSIHDQDGRLAMEVEPEFRHRVISEKTAAMMRQALRKVVTDGTGRRANIEEYELGGKTGTANMIANEAERKAGLRGYSKTRHTANFVALLPWDKPRAVLCVSIRETGKYGGEAASPVVAAIAKRVMAYWGIPAVNGQAVAANPVPMRFEDEPAVPVAYTVGAPDDENRLEEEVDPRIWEEWVEDPDSLG